mgnify:FL=1|jgi:hypothetical protein|tara:strand:- start:782 stop:1105 length:324 start_codon:yes stop_codon:yes gene_type:complete
MPISWNGADISPAQLAANPELSKFTFSEFSTAYEAYLKRGRYSKKDYQEFYDENLDKKKKMISLILKVKGKTIKDNVIIPDNVNIALSNIDLVIQEVLNKPKVNVYA